MYKQIELTSKQPILADANVVLNAVNELRKEQGSTKADKKPITLDQFIATTKVLEERTDDFGMLRLTMHYDKDGIPSSREFPNFGLEVTSKSTLAMAGQNIEVMINVVVKAGKKKWQLEEIAECVDVLSNENTIFRLEFISDQTTDRAGFSTPFDVANGDKDRFGIPFIPSNFFSCSFK